MLADTLSIYKASEKPVKDGLKGPITYGGGDPNAVIQKHHEKKQREAAKKKAVRKAFRK